MKRIKKLLVALAITALAMNFLAGVGSTVQAFNWGDGGDWGELLFGGGKEGALSFTQYQGGLAELDAEGYDSALTASGDLKEFVLRVVNFALGFLGLIAVLMIIYAGVVYVTSAGQDEKTGNAKKTITYATIGLLIVLGSFAFVNTVIRSAVIGEGGKGGGGIMGQTQGRGFNAIAEEVKGIALDIYTGYVELADNTEIFNDIQTDMDKTSLKIESLPSRAEVNAFLQSTKAKLNSMKAKTGNLTEVTAQINEKIREIEDKMDELNTYGTKGLVKIEKSGEAGNCDPAEDGFWDEFKEMWVGKEKCVDQGYVPNDAGADFLNEWNAYKTNTATTSPNLVFDEIITNLGEAYAKRLSKNLDRLFEIHDSIKSIDAIKNGKANEYYTTMLDNTTAANIVSKSYAGSYGDLYTAVTTWDKTKIVDTAEDYLVPALEAHSKYYAELSKLQFVNAVLTADIIRGNEGMTVIFDVGQSSDPAGGSILKNSIIWDPAGQLVVNGVLSLEDSTVSTFAKENDMICEESNDGISDTGLRCTFFKAGTYLATVIINSNEPDKYGPGVSFLRITVNPPTTKINLKAKMGDNRKIDIMKYEEEDTGNLQTPEKATPSTRINKSRIDIVDTEIKNLTFDASETTNVYMYKWNFGNGEVLDWGAQNSIVGSAQFGDYPVGSYQITLEVMNEAGVVDKKIFTLAVKKIAANISEINIPGLPKGTATVKVPITFDGSSSTASTGNKIDSYKWEISKLEHKAANEATIETPFVTKQGPTMSTYTHTFDKAGLYKVKLTVEGSGSGPANTSTSEIDLKVISKPPVAEFNYEIPEKTQPSTVVFENESIDPEDDELKYTWAINPDKDDIKGASPGKQNWEFISGDDLNSENPTIKFNEKGKYKIKLKAEVATVTEGEEVSEIEKEIEITDILDISWDKAKQKTVGKTGEDVDFYFNSTNAVAYEIDFGDGDTEVGESFPPEAPIQHKYRQSGKYIVTVTVYDEDDDENSIKKKMLISGADMPAAYASVFVNGAEIIDNTEPVEVTRADELLFSAAQSVNTDGTGRKLKYSWDLGDMTKSSLKEVSHSYEELSPKDTGFYEVNLSVFDEKDATKTSTDKMQINVCPAPPKYTSIEITPQLSGKDLITPAIINVKAYGVKDADNGKIVKYRWWYFDPKKPNEEYGMVITTAPAAQLTIGSQGNPNEKKEYAIGLEITDDDGLTYCNTEGCKPAMIASYKQYPTCKKMQILAEKEMKKNYATIIVINEKNELPKATFKASKTSLKVGEEITFTSSSTDSDGKIVKYQWDVEGDGFYNNAPTDKASITHKYTSKNMEGYGVKLKVTDNKGGEAVSEATKIYVDAIAKEPEADFSYEVVAESGGQTIQFKDNSKADDDAGTKIIKYLWDFGTEEGGSSNKTIKNPQKRYSKEGTYEVKLTVTDDQGNTDEKKKSVIVKFVAVTVDSPPPASTTPDAPPVSTSLTGTSPTATVPEDTTTSPVVSGNQPVGLGVGIGNNPIGQTPPASQSDIPQEIPGGVPIVPVLTVRIIENGIITTPTTDNAGIIYLTNPAQRVILDFRGSTGGDEKNEYIIDKNIYYDTKGDGIRDNDRDYATTQKGTLETFLDKNWGQIHTLKLTVRDAKGNENSVLQKIKLNY
ncbi:MAG: PKD domain-containing protein [Candidatus Gracilibacteria bacterium]|nr:PKD domain-containing protein [Candidatus Gracilibacteria bacterium]